MHITLSKIRWAGEDNLPSTLHFPLTQDAVQVWNERLHDQFRGNRFEFRKLLRDVFQVEAERKYDREILWCQMNISEKR